MRKVVSIPLKEGIFEFKGRDLRIYLLIKLVNLLLYLLPVIYIGYVLINHWNEVKAFALKLNTFGNFILSFLTAILVVITGFYALFTHRMLAQMTETRQAEVRPNLWVKLDKPEFKKRDYYYDDETQDFETMIHVANYGKGAAVSIRIEYSVPHQWSEEDKCDERIHATERDNVPVLLSPLDTFERRLHLPTKLMGIVKNYPEYLRLRIIYEDTERTLYELKQSYYLVPNPISGNISYHLYLEGESLHFLPFHRRTSTQDIDGDISGDGILVFKRKHPWRLG